MEYYPEPTPVIQPDPSLWSQRELAQGHRDHVPPLASLFPRVDTTATMTTVDGCTVVTGGWNSEAPIVEGRAW